jgi:hypothetical protein
MSLQTLTLLVAAAMTVVGAWGKWRFAWYCSTVEEGVKEYRLTRMQAHRRVLLLQRGIPILTSCGVALLIAALFCLGG